MIGKFILFIAATMFAFTGCALVGASKLINKEVIPGKDSIIPSPDLVTADTDPHRVIDDAHKRMCEVRSYRTRTELTGPTGASAVTTAEFVRPDRRRTVQFAGTNAEFETITIGSRTFSRSQGRWSEMTGPLSKAYADPGFMCSNEAPPPLPADLPKIERKFIGTGDVDGNKVLLYSSAVGGGEMPGGNTMTVTASIGTRDGLLYRTESRSTSVELGTITTTTTYSDYNADIRIEAPI